MGRRKTPKADKYSVRKVALLKPAEAARLENYVRHRPTESEAGVLRRGVLAIIDADATSKGAA